MRSLRPSILLTTHDNKKTVVNRKNLGFQSHNLWLKIGKKINSIPSTKTINWSKKWVS